jgi:hypothetical protein
MADPVCNIWYGGRTSREETRKRDMQNTYKARQKYKVEMDKQRGGEMAE